jgi:hypothetical protein
MTKRRFSNTSQSSWDLSDGERRKEKRKEKIKQTEEPINSGSIVGIDWLFENGEGEPWTNKSKYKKYNVHKSKFNVILPVNENN